MSVRTAHGLTQRGPSPIAERLAELVGGSAGQTSVFGAAVERDGITVIPVARSKWGFGGGSGQEDGATGRVGSGGGGAAHVRPVGFIEIAGGRARFRRIVDPTTVASVLVAVALLGFLGLRRRRAPGRFAGRHGRSETSAEDPTGTPQRDRREQLGPEGSLDSSARGSR